MSVLKECNRCKATFRKNTIVGKNEIGEDVLLDEIETAAGVVDLCDACWAEYLKFMENRKDVVLLDPDKVTCKDCTRRIANPIDNKITFCRVFHRVTLDSEKMCPFVSPKQELFV